MILLVVPADELEGREIPFSPRSFVEPSLVQPAFARADSEQPVRFVAWMEVYPTVTDLFAAVVDVARGDPVCLGMLATLELELGLGVLRPKFLRQGMNLVRTAALFYEVLSAWCDPLVGNPQTPAPPSQKLSARLAVWTERFRLDDTSAEAIRRYEDEERKTPRVSPAPRAQVRVFFNIVDLTRAVLSEVVTSPIRRVDKLFALELCLSPKLLARQRALIRAYLDAHGAQIIAVAKDGKLTINETQYLKYYLGPLAQTVGKKAEVVPTLLRSFADVALGVSVEPDEIIREALEVWRRLPPVIQCAILFNDLRKLYEVAEREAAKGKVEEKDEAKDKEKVDNPGAQTFVRASLVFPKFDVEAPDPERKLWPADYDVRDPGGAPPRYPDNNVGFLRAWNPDEYSLYAITYRMNLCPLWAGPSGHTVNALRHWIHALGDEKAPADTAEVVAASLFTFWRLYYDKRISAAHTITEAFEATFVTAAGVSAVRAGFTIAPAPSKERTLPASRDAFDLVAFSRAHGVAEGAIHPVGLLRALCRALVPSRGFAGLDGLKRAIDEARLELTKGGVVLQQWSQDPTNSTGIAVRSYEPSKDTDLRPIPLAIRDLAVHRLGRVLERVRDEDDVMILADAPWWNHRRLIGAVRLAPSGEGPDLSIRDKRLGQRHRAVLQLLGELDADLVRLASDVSTGFFRNGWLRAYVPSPGAVALEVTELRRRIAGARAQADKGPRRGPVSGSVLSPETAAYVEAPLLRLRGTLEAAARSPAAPPAQQRALLAYATDLGARWTALRRHVPAARVEEVLPAPLSKEIAAALRQTISVLEAAQIVVGNLARDSRGKAFKAVGGVLGTDARQASREIAEDLELLGSIVPLRFLDAGTRALVALKLGQVAALLPANLARLQSSCLERRSSQLPGTLSGALRAYADRLQHLLPRARALRGAIADDSVEVPDERISLPALDLRVTAKTEGVRWLDPRGKVKSEPSASEPTSRRSAFATRTEPARSSFFGGGDQHWYTGEEISLLLRIRLNDLRDRLYTMVGIDSTLHDGFTLSDNLREARVAAFLADADTILLPVHVGHDHWTALFIHFPGDYDSPVVQYADPQGTRALPGPVRDAIELIFPGATIRPRSTTAYQPAHDGHNCGPWTVLLLEHMARNGGALPAAGAVQITQRRREDRRLVQRD
ncbi:hypothetical protein L6R52_12425 [Myxococcota bacterium]|nr:hypothetical protein [Myxococcota bacterium]